MKLNSFFYFDIFLSIILYISVKGITKKAITILKPNSSKLISENPNIFDKNGTYITASVSKIVTSKDPSSQKLVVFIVNIDSL